MHRQRIALIVLAILGLGSCFLPWGQEPVMGSLTGIGLLQLVAVVLGALVLIPSLLGPLGRAMSESRRTLASLGVLLLPVLGVARIVVVGYYWIPTFSDDDPRAKDYYERACNAGRVKACVLLGTCYWTGTCGQSKNVELAIALYEKACTASVASACGQLGVCYELGGCGVAKSNSKAVAMYEKACNGGEMDMCNNLGVCYHKGECGLFRNLERARALYGKACDGGYAGACYNLSLLKKD